MRSLLARVLLLLLPITHSFVPTPFKVLEPRRQLRRHVTIASSPESAVTAITEAAPLRIIVAGAGVGGLTLTNALLSAPYSSAHPSAPPPQITILEKTSAFKRFGGPIQLASNALKILDVLDPETYELVLANFTFTGDKEVSLTKHEARSTKHATRSMNETVEFPLPISQQIQIQIQIQLLRMVMVGAHGWCAWLVRMVGAHGWCCTCCTCCTCARLCRTESSTVPCVPFPLTVHCYHPFTSITNLLNVM